MAGARGFGAFHLHHPRPRGGDLGAAAQVSDPTAAAGFSSLFPAAEQKTWVQGSVPSAFQGALEDAQTLDPVR